MDACQLTPALTAGETTPFWYTRAETGAQRTWHFSPSRVKAASDPFSQAHPHQHGSQASLTHSYFGLALPALSLCQAIVWPDLSFLLGVCYCKDQTEEQKNMSSPAMGTDTTQHQGRREVISKTATAVPFVSNTAKLLRTAPKLMRTDKYSQGFSLVSDRDGARNSLWVTVSRVTHQRGKHSGK